MLTKEQILAADDLKREKVSVPEWGGHVWVRVMSGAERDAYELSITRTKDKLDLSNIRARLAVLTICDDAGQRIFSDADVAELGKKSASALERVFVAAQKINAVTNADIEELEKNSGSGLSAASGSDSPAN